MTYSKLNSDLGEFLTDSTLHTGSRDLHVVPDLHGNRSPLALPWFRGMVSGLDLNSSYKDLLALYLATVQGVALGVRLVIDKLRDHGLNFSNIVICGGLADNPLYLVVLATVAKVPVTVPRAGNMMCAGAALLAQCAAEERPLSAILESEVAGSDVSVYSPIRKLVAYYEMKYKVYRSMASDQVKYREIMHGGL